MADLHTYQAHWETKDPQTGKVIASGVLDLYSDEHHSEHGGVHQESWLEHVHSVAKDAIRRLLDAAGYINQAVMTYKSFEYMGKRWSASRGSTASASMHNKRR